MAIMYKHGSGVLKLLRGTYQPEETALLLIMVNKLQHRALNWYYSRADHVELS